MLLRSINGAGLLYFEMSLLDFFVLSGSIVVNGWLLIKCLCGGLVLFGIITNFKVGGYGCNINSQIYL